MLPGLNRLKLLAGDEAYAVGEALFQHGGVREDSVNASGLKYLVNDGQQYVVVLSAGREKGCGCEACSETIPCAHVVAAMLKANATGALGELQHRLAMQAGADMISSVDRVLPQEGNTLLSVELKADYTQGIDRPSLRIQLYCGENRLYVVRSIPAFLESIRTGTPVDFGKGFLFQPAWMRFGKTETRILEILGSICSAQKDAGFEYKGNDARQMPLFEPFAGYVLDELVNLAFKISVQDREYKIRKVRQGRIPLHFRVSGTLRGLSITGFYPKDILPLTSDGKFILAGGSVLQVDEDQRETLLAMVRQEQNGRALFEFPPKDTERVVDEVIPVLKMIGVVELSDELDRLLERRPLVGKVYLDRAGKNVVAETVFVYGDREINPFKPYEVSQTFQRGQKMLLRDAEGERRILDTLAMAGFSISQGRVYLSNQEAIYSFVSEGVRLLQQICEVYLSRDFKKMTPRRPSLRGKAGIQGGYLRLTFEGDTKADAEIQGIMEALSRKREYFRLKDGTFLDLTDMDEWQPVAEYLTDAVIQEEIRQGERDSIQIHAYRSFYVAELLKHAGVEIPMDEELTQMVRVLGGEDVWEKKIPDSIHLWPYQERGFQWICSLDEMHMGGILADDMGLGKTVQVISAVVACSAENDISLVVCPTSLTYNWLSELNRFAPELKTVVLSGTGNQRNQTLSMIREGNHAGIQVLIVSYPLIRRDIDQMTDIPFHFVILDEAQQIKNSGSAGAAAVKQLTAQSRFALSGTPVENHAGELWSLFDFALPGYLGSLSGFLRKYQDGNRMAELRQKIRPFLMRRLKKDVLTELPDKMETLRIAQMTPEQEKVYRAAKLRGYQRMEQIMKEKGFSRGRMDVLSVITELRQICCHPALVLDNYSYSSGKMELLMDMLPEALQQGRRILLFSQFTSMLRILQKQLEAEEIRCLYLDGQTLPEERMHLCQQFNQGEGDVFLISLKAGGTGLNLTGADMVIHYDPWWNPAVEDQATDRAHRIGQKHKVEVIRLLTHGTIEEQVVELSRNKKQLFDQLIEAGEENLSSLSEDAIRALFSDMEEELGAMEQ